MCQKELVLAYLYTPSLRFFFLYLFFIRIKIIEMTVGIIQEFPFLFSGERNDYGGGIDNESLDFSQLEDFINNETDSDPT